MRKSRLIAVSVAVATAASIAVPVTTQTAAFADDTVVETPVVTPKPTPAPAPVIKKPTAAELAAKRAAAKRKAQAERLRKRHLMAVQMRKRIVRYALSKRWGGQYVAGASSAWSFDCSGFVKHVYWRITRINLPHYSGAQLNLRRGIRVPKRRLLPGDILAWGSNGSQHVSIYIGRGLMVGANNPSRDVVVEPINSSYWAPRYAGARRLILG